MEQQVQYSEAEYIQDTDLRVPHVYIREGLVLYGSDDLHFPTLFLSGDL